MSPNREKLALFFILIMAALLDIYGLNWGLPSRWNVDQPVSVALNMLKDKNFFPKDYFEPSLYYYVILFFLAPFLACNYFFNHNFQSFVSDAKISWNFMGINHPQIASGIFIVARLSSVIFSLTTIFFTYKLAKRVYGSKAGIFAALMLALTMDFVNWAHMEKSISLVNLFTVLAVYYLVSLYQRKEYSRRAFIASCLCAGLASSVKFNGMVTFLVIPLAAGKMCVEVSGVIRRGIRISREMFLGSLIFFATLFATSPALIYNSGLYYANSIQKRQGTFLSRGPWESIINWLPNMAGIMHALMDMFGVVLFLLICMGFIYCLRKRLIKNTPIKLLYFFCCAVILFFSFNKRVLISPDSKFFIQIVPFLTILSGVFIQDFFDRKIMSGITQKIKYGMLFFVFAISFVYCLSADRIFFNKDLRYESTRWFLNQQPGPVNIIINTQLENGLGIGVLERHNVYVLAGKGDGNVSYFFKGGKYFSMDEKACEDVRKVIFGGGPVYVVVPRWNFKSGRQYESDRMESVGNKLKLVKSLERRNPWFWNPSLGGYEPSGIDIYKWEN